MSLVLYCLLRGGSWGNRRTGARASNRNGFAPANRNQFIGLRCARKVK